MAKTITATLIADIKALVDYNITDTDLDALIIKGLNFGQNRMKQWFQDEGMLFELGASDTFLTIANQNYINIVTETIDFDHEVILTERENDREIPIISIKEFRRLFTDPTATVSNVPIAGAFYANKLYIGPTPDSAITLYLDYTRLLTKFTTSGTASETSPYPDKYDELLVAIAIEHIVKWMDRDNQAAINSAKLDVLTLKHDLIVAASKPYRNQQVERRVDMPSYGRNFNPGVTADEITDENGNAILED